MGIFSKTRKEEVKKELSTVKLFDIAYDLLETGEHRKATIAAYTLESAKQTLIEQLAFRGGKIAHISNLGYVGDLHLMSKDLKLKIAAQMTPALTDEKRIQKTRQENDIKEAKRKSKLYRRKIVKGEIRG